ncbi:unnamed protein product [Arabidopsis halleri]
MHSLTNVVKSRILPILISTTVANEQPLPVVSTFCRRFHSPSPRTTYPPDPINLHLAIFNTDTVVVQNGPIGYSNMFYMIFDAFVWAIEKEGIKDLPMVVIETGWPCAGNGNLITPEIASIYNNNFVKHVESGKGPGHRRGQTIA